MRFSNELPVVYLCGDVVDLCKGINGVAHLCHGNALDASPLACRERLAEIRQAALPPIIGYMDYHAFKTHLSRRSGLFWM